MSTHFVPGLGHRTFKDGDTIPANAVPRPIANLETHSIINTEHGYAVADIPQEKLDEKREFAELRDASAGTLEERLARLERILRRTLRV